jgi:acetyl-CoA/propionyl-CoA carboxylase, biotin carboxylase, biotin carboxyl carrier protein
MWVPEAMRVAVAAGGGGSRQAPQARRAPAGRPAPAGAGKVTVPMQGTDREGPRRGRRRGRGRATVCVLEAMKMENNIAADKAGTVAEVKVERRRLGRLRRRPDRSPAA